MGHIVSSPREREKRERRDDDDDDEFRFNDASTHEGHLRQNGELTWFCNETIIMISHKCIKCKTRTNERRDSRGDEREGQRRNRNRNESEETEEIKKTFLLCPYLL